MTVPFPSCLICQRLHERSGREEAKKCDAFPEGIPQVILDADERHLEPFPGDHGLQFTAVPGYEEMEARWRDPETQRRWQEEQAFVDGLRGR